MTRHMDEETLSHKNQLAVAEMPIPPLISAGVNTVRWTSAAPPDKYFNRSPFQILPRSLQGR